MFPSQGGSGELAEGKHLRESLVLSHSHGLPRGPPAPRRPCPQDSHLGHGQGRTREVDGNGGHTDFPVRDSRVQGGIHAGAARRSDAARHERHHSSFPEKLWRRLASGGEFLLLVFISVCFLLSFPKVSCFPVSRFRSLLLASFSFSFSFLPPPVLFLLLLSLVLSPLLRLLFFACSSNRLLSPFFPLLRSTITPVGPITSRWSPETLSCTSPTL